MPTATHRNEFLAAPRRAAADPLHSEVREIMSPGVTSVVEDASLRQAYRALQAHRVHAILVLGLADGRPLGWVTAKGLLGWIGADDTMRPARDAIAEDPLTIDPSATAAEAISLLARPEVSRLLVQRGPGVLPGGRRDGNGPRGASTSVVRLVHRRMRPVLVLQPFAVARPHDRRCAVAAGPATG